MFLKWSFTGRNSRLSIRCQRSFRKLFIKLPLNENGSRLVVSPIETKSQNSRLLEVCWFHLMKPENVVSSRKREISPRNLMPGQLTMQSAIRSNASLRGESHGKGDGFGCAFHFLGQSRDSSLAHPCYWPCDTERANCDIVVVKHGSTDTATAE